MQYEIISYTRGIHESKEEALNNMATKVNSYMELGWKVSGGIAVESGTFYQAIVWDPNTKEEN